MSDSTRWHAEARERPSLPAGLRRSRVTIETTRRPPFSKVIAVGAGLLVLSLHPTPAMTQVRESQHGSVVQTVDATTIVVEYFRPVARGRALFGDLVKWNDIWTPGANWATTIEVDQDVQVENQRLPMGKYSIWVSPKNGEDWIVMFSRAVPRFHAWVPLPDQEQLRISVTPEGGPHVEVLTWSFPMVRRDGALLRMQWGTTFIQFLVSVGPSNPVVIAAEELKRFVGRWMLTFMVEGRDSTMVVEVVDVNGRLQLRGYQFHPHLDAVTDLVPIGGGQFHPSFYSRGEATGIDAGILVVFQTDASQATGIELRGRDDQAFARGIQSGASPGASPQGTRHVDSWSWFAR